jgi:hypothetical protein
MIIIKIIKIVKNEVDIIWNQKLKKEHIFLI